MHLRYHVHTVCVYMCSQALVPTYSPPTYPKSDSMAQVEKDLGLKEEHSDFVQRQIRKFCLKCILPHPATPSAPLTFMHPLTHSAPLTHNYQLVCLDYLPQTVLLWSTHHPRRIVTVPCFTNTSCTGPMEGCPSKYLPLWWRGMRCLCE